MELTGVSVGRGAPVLSGVDWRVGADEWWFVVGPNGAGKSTLLATALGRLPALAGTVFRTPGLAVASLPQRCGLARELPSTVAEVVALGLIDVHRGEQAVRCAEVLSTCGLSTLAGRQVWELSGGERQRTLIARALALKPRLLVLDEPTAGLDAVSERGLLTTIDKLVCAGMAVVFVTHDLRLTASRMARVALVGGGRLQEVPAQEVMAAALALEIPR